MAIRCCFLLLSGVTLLVLPFSPRSIAVPVAKDAKATEWTMYGGTTHRNMINTVDRGTPSAWSDDPDTRFNIIWKGVLGSRTYTCPVVVGGRVFVGANNENPRNRRDLREVPNELPEPVDKGILMCFGAKNGEFLWQAVHDKLASGLVNDWPREGLPCTPTVDSGRVYYVSNRGEVVCADFNGFLDGRNDGATDEMYTDKTDADFIWRFDMPKELKVFPHNMSHCSPLIVGDRLFVCTSNGVDEGHINIPAPEAPSFIALDKNTGKLLWKSNLPGKNIMHGQWASPAYGVIQNVPQVIFPAGDGWLYAFKPESGELLWKFDANPKDAKYNLGGQGTRSDFIGAPVIYKERVFIGVG